MLAKNFGALQSLQLLRQKRPIKINTGFLQQIADLEHQLNFCRNENLARSDSEEIDK